MSQSSQLRRLQQRSVMLFMLIGIFNFIDRATLAVANPMIRDSLGLSIAQMGLLLSVFLWFYAACSIPAGMLADRFGVRRVMAGSVLIWSAAQTLCGMAGGLASFMVARGLLGVGEAPVFPLLVRLARDWFPPADRGRPIGLGFATSKIGPALAPLLLTPVMLALGWRPVFILTGVISVGLAVLWLLAYRDPATPPEQTQSTFAWADVGRLLKQRTTWGMTLGVFGEFYMGWVYVTWLPGYLEIERHLSIPHTGWIAGIPFAVGIIGSVGSGWVVEKLVVRGASPVNATRIPMIFGLICMAGFTVVAALATSTAMAVASISVAMLFNGLTGAVCITMASAIAPDGCTATLHGIQNTGGFIGAALAPVVTGVIVQQTGSFIPALLLSAAIGLTCALIYLFGVPGRPIRFPADAMQGTAP